MVDREGRSHQSVEVTTTANEPENFLPTATNVAPHSFLAGWVAVDAADPFTPARFQLAFGDTVWTVRFVGEETVLVPGG